MDNRILIAPQANAVLAADSLLRATSLLYLQDALERERYEECAGLIQSAKGFGASQREVSSVIAKYIRKSEAGRGEAAKRNRLFIK